MTHTTRLALPAVVDAVKALAHPGRLRILAMLRGGDLCVCQVTAALGLAASTVSSHLSDLRRAGFVTERKSGKWVHYRLVDDGPLAALGTQAIRLAEDDDQLRQDVRAVSVLRKVSLDIVCTTGFELKTIGAAPSTPAKRSRRNPSRTRRQA
jgi:DNA-binding transcriptional ArsR family regulator